MGWGGPPKFLFGGLLLAALGGLWGTVAGHLLSEFHDDAVVNEAVDDAGCGHGIFKYLFPL